MKNIPRRAVGGVAALATVAFLAACAPSSSGDDESELRIANAFALPAFDPFNFAHTWLPGGNAVYDVLVIVDGEGEDPKPWIASEWELSDDERTVTFQLRDDVDFVDGTHLDAAGLADYFTALFVSEGFIWKGTTDKYGTTATAVDEYTLELDNPLAPVDLDWWWTISITPIASPATVGVEGAFDDGPVGSGPYVIDEIDGDSYVSLVRNPDYWQPELFPYDKVTFTQYLDAISTLNAVKTGQIDAGPIEVPLAQEALDSGLNISQGPGDVPLIYVADHTGAIIPALGDVRVRQAMAYAFDRAAILENTNLGFGTTSSQGYLPIQPEYVQGADDRYALDLDHAKALMAEAGYADGFDVTIPTLAGTTFFGTTDLEPIVQTTLAEIGIRVTYEAYGGDVANYLADVVTSNRYPMYIAHIAHGNLTTTFEEGGWGPHGDAEFADLLATRLAGNADERAEAYRGIGEFLLENAWYVTMGVRSAVFASADDVGIEIEGTYSMPKLYEYTPTD